MNADAVYGEIAALPGISEPVSSLSHLLSAILVAVFLGPLLLRAARCRRVWCVATGQFVVAAFLLFVASGIYHLLEPGTELRAIAQRIDHAAIWLLIAASFTALHTFAWRGPWRRALLALVWTVALTGLVLKTVFFESLGEAVGLAFYLGLGWFGVLIALKLIRAHGVRTAIPLLAGGACYTLGAILEFARTPVLIPHVVGPHELFHLAVMAGLACHAVQILRLLELRKLELGLVSLAPPPQKARVDAATTGRRRAAPVVAA